MQLSLSPYLFNPTVNVLYVFQSCPLQSSGKIDTPPGYATVRLDNPGIC